MSLNGAVTTNHDPIETARKPGQGPMEMALFLLVIRVNVGRAISYICFNIYLVAAETTGYCLKQFCSKVDA